MNGRLKLGGKYNLKTKEVGGKDLRYLGTQDFKGEPWHNFGEWDAEGYTVWMQIRTSDAAYEFLTEVEE